MNRPTFMRKYNAFFDSIGRNPSNPKVDADTLKWLPLCFIVVSGSSGPGMCAEIAARHRDALRPTRDCPDKRSGGLVKAVLRFSSEWLGVRQGATA
jgi:hypothetical protein